MKRPILLLLSLSLAAMAQPARAQTSDDTPPADGASSSRSEGGQAASVDGETKVRRAQNHFQRAVALYEEGNYDAALSEFTRAHELVPNYRVLYNLAQTQVERHDYVDAVRLFNEYLEQGGTEIASARRQAVSRERDGLLERIANVQLESNVGGAELWIDGRSRGVVPSSYSLRLNAGPAEVRLQKAGYAPMTRQLSLAGGDSLVLEMNLDRTAPLETTPAARVGDSPRPPEASHTGLWVSLVTTTLFAGATATFAVLTTNANSDLDRELGQYQDDSSNLDAGRSRVKTYAALTDGFGVATALGFGSMLYFIFRDSGTGERANASAARLERDSGLRVLFGASSVTLRGEF